MKCYYLDPLQNQQGPYSDLWIAHLIRSGALDENVRIWGDQIGEWMSWNDYAINVRNYIECPHCGSQLKIDSDWFEKKLQCPECNGKFHVSPINSLPLWDVFDKISGGEWPFIRQWLFEREKFHSNAASNTNVGGLKLVLPDHIAALKTAGRETSDRAETEVKIKLVNHIVSCQIFLLCCLVLGKQLKRTSVLEFREYCILSGLDAVAFDKILSYELSKAFIAVNHDNRDHNEVYYFKNIADYYKKHIKCDRGTFFAPIYNALIPWYNKTFLRNVSIDNYLVCLADLKKLAAEPDFLMFAGILKDVGFKEKFEKIICTKIASDDFSQKEFAQMEACLAPWPFGMEWLFNSKSIKQSVADCCMKHIDLILQGERSVLPDFADAILDQSETDDLDDRIAEKLLPMIVGKKMNFEGIRRVFDILEYFGFGIDLAEKLFTLKFIFPYLLSEDTSAVFSFPVLLAEQVDLPCPECDGTGAILCPKCDGTGKMKCPECNGEGTDYSLHFHRTVNCGRCQGRKKLRCDNGCRKIDGCHRIVCRECWGKKTVAGLRTANAGTFEIERGKCFILDENSKKIPFESPIEKAAAPTHMDDAMTSFCEGKDCFFFTDKNGLVFCAGKNALIDSEYMIDVVSRFCAEQAKQAEPPPAPVELKHVKKPECSTDRTFSASPDKRVRSDAAVEEKTSVGKDAALSENERIYLKSFMVANKDGVIDAAERKMLEYQAFNILKLTPERVGELEAMAQFLNEGDVR